MCLDNPKRLIELIETNFPRADYISEENGEWIVTDEWLVGTFAGRGFVGKTAEEAAQHLIEYLNEHIGHDSIVGNIVAESGWPNVDAVAAYINRNDAEEGESK